MASDGHGELCGFSASTLLTPAAAVPSPFLTQSINQLRQQVQWAGLYQHKETGMIATFAKLQIGVGWAINPCR